MYFQRKNLKIKKIVYYKKMHILFRHKNEQRTDIL